MRILFIIRATAFSAPGGDTIQARATAKGLKQYGVEAELKLSSDKINYDRYRGIHFFNIIRPADILKHAKRSGLPYVISPIYVDYSRYEKYNRSGLVRLAGQLLTSDGKEYAKAMVRRIKNSEKIQSRQYLLAGHRRSIQYLIRHAAMLLPNSESEVKRLFQHYGVAGRYHVIPNGIDDRIFQGNTESNHRSGIICVAQVYGLKNQLNLIRALEGTGHPLTIIGKPTANGWKYYEKCRAAAGENVHFVDFLPQVDLVQYYRTAKVHAMPSWFETTGLSSLESAAMGCNVVTTRHGDAHEYLGEEALYADPADVGDIREKVLEAYQKQPPVELSRRILSNFTWRKTAEQTFKAYQTAFQ